MRRRARRPLESMNTTSVRSRKSTAGGGSAASTEETIPTAASSVAISRSPRMCSTADSPWRASSNRGSIPADCTDYPSWFRDAGSPMLVLYTSQLIERTRTDAGQEHSGDRRLRDRRRHWLRLGAQVPVGGCDVGIALGPSDAGLRHGVR